MNLKKCKSCKTYTLKDKCPRCKTLTISGHYKFVRVRNAPKSDVKKVRKN